MTRLERQSGCKVNLLLNILGKRPDGFHELETVMHPVALFDTLRFEQLDHPGVELSCNHPSLPTDSTNLVVRAALAFFQAAGLAGGCRIHLEKHIPLAAGLGGGSSNAAVTLLALNDLFGHPLDSAHLESLAAALGSDVPFFLQTSPGLGVGRGDQMTPLEPFQALRGLSILLIHPGFGVATAWAYQALAAFSEAMHGQAGRAQRLIHALRGTSFEQAAPQFYNALEKPVLQKYPVLALYQEFLRRHGALATLMSGSGSTTYAVVPSVAAGEELAQRFKGEFGSQCWSAVAPF